MGPISVIGYLENNGGGVTCKDCKDKHPEKQWEPLYDTECQAEPECLTCEECGTDIQEPFCSECCADGYFENHMCPKCNLKRVKAPLLARLKDLAADMWKALDKERYYGEALTRQDVSAWHDEIESIEFTLEEMEVSND